MKDERGAVVVLARLNSSTLQELAQVTGGAYTDASSWIDLASLLKKTVEAGTKGDFSEKNTARKIERFQWFLAPGLLLLLISFWAEFPVRPGNAPCRCPRAFSPQPIKQNAAAQTSRRRLRSCALCAFRALVAPLRRRAFAVRDSPAETFRKPLATTVARLAEQPAITAKDYAELATTTITYGQRAKSAQQHAPEVVINDALQGVDIGEKLDAKAARMAAARAESRISSRKTSRLGSKKEGRGQEKSGPAKTGSAEKPAQNQDKNQPKDQEQGKVRPAKTGPAKAAAGSETATSRTQNQTRTPSAT